MVVQLASILVYPFLDNRSLGRTLFSVVSVAAVALAVYAVRATPALTWVSLTLGAPLLVLTAVEAVHPVPWAVLASAVVHALFYGYTCYAMIRYMFADDHATVDEVWATGAAFTVLAWAFTYAYSAVQIVWPGSFTAGVDPEQPRSWMELLFLSVTTLTSTGLSDIVPLRAHARSVVMLEQIAGMLYLALVVARIGALLARRQRPPGGPSVS
ncbi:two pore domain potassium channel family protein [Auraticoccus sp. F435]|uniref:Two pore domain potassium channel family protein n=2 Tax=Auraticoccus cholistanensis TaxID=2656650 RepID=A0A6A9UPY4_9ACTN|nr:potassium channel family protein [Auraticoccus cholistanensis]MVA74956.1 two pore domain potassium channel family protein [Auraticoccus cholistanensis]